MNRKNVRKYPRIDAVISVEYTLGNATFRSQATTIGGGGLFVEIRDPVAAGTEVSIRFRLAKHLPVIEAKGKVRYQFPGKGAAIEFTEISPQHRQLLLRIIHRKTADKRKFPRAPLATQIQGDEFMTVAFSRDVSLGGMFVETRRPLAVGSRINLRFNLDDGPVVSVIAEVIYKVPGMGMGVQFSDVSPEDRKRIGDYVARSRTVAQATAEASSGA